MQEANRRVDLDRVLVGVDVLALILVVALVLVMVVVAVVVVVVVVVAVAVDLDRVHLLREKGHPSLVNDVARRGALIEND